MDTITGRDMAAAVVNCGGLAILHRFMSVEDNVQEFVTASKRVVQSQHIGVSVGVNEGILRASALYDSGARIFCVDVAHGHSKLAGDMVKNLKQSFKDIFIIAGNVSTAEGANYLANCGADMVKVGQGPGSACTTRIKTGFGVPQLSAVMDCARCQVPIIADGGIKTSGDVSKAIAAGAKMVMLGGMLAGTDETPGEAIDGYKEFRGMASKEAFEDFYGAMPDWKTAEGVSAKVKCKGPVAGVFQDIVGGLRSALTYNGSSNLEELARTCEFIEISSGAKIENTSHILQT